jgi:hypothetical protein
VTAISVVRGAETFMARVQHLQGELADAWAFSTGSRLERSLVSDARTSIASADAALTTAAPGLDAALVQGARGDLATVDAALTRYETATGSVPLVGSIQDGDQLARRTLQADRVALGQANGALGEARESAELIRTLDVDALRASLPAADATTSARLTRLPRYTIPAVSAGAFGITAAVTAAVESRS